MRADDLVAVSPTVLHAAHAGSWPSIQQHGLMSTAGLMDLFEVDPVARRQLLTRPRSASVRLVREGLHPALVRDQKPMKFLREKLEPGHTREDFLMAINSRVFFWPDQDRLERLRKARAYRGEAQVVLHVDSRELVARYERDIELCRFNSGAITHVNHPVRSRGSWIPLGDYPFEDYRRRFGRSRALAEVTVLRAVPDVLDFVVDVEFLAATR